MGAFHNMGISLLAFLLISQTGIAKVYQGTRSDTVIVGDTEALYAEIVDAARVAGVAQLPFGELVQWSAEYLLGAPYEAGLLDNQKSERLVLNLTSFDCVLFVEAVLAVARNINTGRIGIDTFADEILKMRYRDGRTDGYCSRLHYFTDWIHENQKRGIIQDISRETGGITEVKALTFMSSHRSAYKNLADDSVFACIRQMEAGYENNRHIFVPQDTIAAVYSHLQAGDIIATSTYIEGLDVTHTGFVYRSADGVGLLHASSSGEVKVSPDLADYIAEHASQRGILVIRPLDPGMVD